MALSNPITAPPRRRLALVSAAAAGALLLGGCAAFNQLPSEVSTYSQWPAGRQPGSFVFERLPSQQARAEQQQRLEDAARPALEAAGFNAAADGAAADFSVQLGARVSGTDPLFYDDPLWWHGGLYRPRFGLGVGYGGFGRGRFGGGFGLGLGWGWPTPNYEREVAVLVRDRKSGLPLYESRATNDGASPAIDSLLGAMFEAALKDFPNGAAVPHVVTTPISP